MSSPHRTPATDRSAAFAATRWSVVQTAAGDDGEASRAALGVLCEQYWRPLYAYARRDGAREAEAQDLVQGFFAALLDGAGVRGVDRSRGSFRSYLLGAFRNHLSHERERARAAKRGGGRAPMPLDLGDSASRVRFEPSDAETPERAFDRAWALSLIDLARARLREELAARHPPERAAALLPFLATSSDGPRIADAASALGVSEVAVKVAVHRLRRRFGELLRDAARETLGEGGDEGDEIRELLSAI